jgi:hypothetical protein
MTSNTPVGLPKDQSFNIIALCSVLLTKILDHLAIICLAISLAGLVATLLLGRMDFFLKLLGLAVPVILASVFLLRRKNVSDISDAPLLDVNPNFLWLVFVVLFNITIISVNFSQDRPLIYFVLISTLTSIISLQIFNKRPNKCLILLASGLLMLNFIYSTTLNVTYYFGTTDLYYHISYAEVTQMLGHVIPRELDLNGYSDFPLFHIFISEASSLLALPIKTALFVVNGIIYSTAVVFIYLIAQYVFNNNRLSLLSCLIYISSYPILLYGVNIVPRTLAYVGFIVLIYLLIKLYTSNNKAYLLPIIVTYIYILLVHQASIFQIIPLLILIFIVERIFSHTHILKTKYLLIFVSIFFSYWAYVSNAFFELLIDSRRDFVFSKYAGEIRTTEIATNLDPVIRDLYANFWASIAVLFLIYGVGFIFLKHKNSPRYSYAVLALIGAIFFIPNPIYSSFILRYIFRIDRLELIFAPFVAVIIAFGLILVLSNLSLKKMGRTVAVLVLIASLFMFPFFSIAPELASDNKELNKELFPNFARYLDFPDYSSLRFVEKYIPNGSVLASDNFVNRYFLYADSDIVRQFGLPYYVSENLIDNASGRPYNLFRYKYYTYNGLFFFDKTIFDYVSVPPGEPFKEMMLDRSARGNLIFNNENDYIYT